MGSLQILTKQLIQLVLEADQIYVNKRESQRKGDFDTEIKPFVEKGREVSQQWEQDMKAYLYKNSLQYFHLPQLKAIIENIELISVQAFFPETSFTRFKNYVTSTIFVLNNLLKELEKNEQRKIEQSP